MRRFTCSIIHQGTLTLYNNNIIIVLNFMWSLLIKPKIILSYCHIPLTVIYKYFISHGQYYNNRMGLILAKQVIIVGQANLANVLRPHNYYILTIVVLILIRDKYVGVTLFLSSSSTRVCVTVVRGQVAIVTRTSELFYVCFKSIIKHVSPTKNRVQL